MDGKPVRKGPLTLIRPSVDKMQAIRLTNLLFGLHVTDSSQVKEFVSYDDRNFYLKGALPGNVKERGNHHDQRQMNEGEFVLKILNHVDSENIPCVNAQNEIMLHLKACGFVCPVPVRSLNGEFTVECEVESSNFGYEEDQKQTLNQQGHPVHRVCAVRLLSFVPGKLLKDVSCTPDLLFNLGCYVAKMNKALQDFHHPGIGDLVKQEWDLSQLSVLERYISLASQSGRDLEVLQYVYNNFVNKVIPQLGDTEKHVIHGDLNDENILVIPSYRGNRHEIASVLDFGDASFSYRVFEVAICMTYMILLRVQQGDTHDEGIRVAGHVLCGYQSIYGLSQSDLSVLYWSVAGRFFQSIVNGMYKQSLEPGNRYLSQSSQLGLNILASYIGFSEDEVLNSWLSIGASQPDS